MSLNLTSDCLARLKEALADALRTLEVDNGMFLDLGSVDKLYECDPKLPQNGRLHESLVGYIGEPPFAQFVLDAIGNELWLLDKYQRDTRKKLIEIEPFRDAEATARRLVDQFETLPWEYQVTIPLPQRLEELLRPNDSSFELSPTIRVIRLTEAFGRRFPLVTSNKRLNRRLSGDNNWLAIGAEKPAWPDGRICLQFTAQGYIGEYGSSATASSVRRLLRSVCGMGLATRLFASRFSYPRPTELFAYVHRLASDGTWHPTTRFELDSSIVRGVGDLEIENLSGVVRPEQKPDFAQNRLHHVSAALRSGEKGEPTILAAQWLFDSYSGQDELLSFVQSMVALEIIFGDRTTSDEIGIGTLIGNRLAYLVGTTHDERSQLISDFKKIYAVRSKIVHSGKPMLTLAERELFHRLRWMCNRAIQEEVNILKAGNEQLSFELSSNAS
jgi:hypothetical protein